MRRVCLWNTRCVFHFLRVEFLWKTDSGYPKDTVTGVTFVFFLLPLVAHKQLDM